MIKNFAIRLIRRKGRNGNFVYTEDNIINQICFVEGYPLCNKSIEEMIQSVNNIKLPSDIMIEMKHNWVGELPDGSPLHVELALKKEGYERVSNLRGTDWFILEDDKDLRNIKKHPRRFLIVGHEDVMMLKNIIWGESKERAIDWTQSEEMRKVIEMGQPYSITKPVEREWWM